MSTLNACKKKIGRPKVASEAAQVRIQYPLLGSLDAWAEAHQITRPEAIRRLIQKGLEAEAEEKDASQSV